MSSFVLAPENLLLRQRPIGLAVAVIMDAEGDE
jgi:hypothetical protein